MPQSKNRRPAEITRPADDPWFRQYLVDMKGTLDDVLSKLTRLEYGVGVIVLVALGFVVRYLWVFFNPSSP